jgi:4-hydroxy-tetrahydrodipicolinate reductase
MKIAISGATGRMGQSITRIAVQERFAIVGAIASSLSAHLGKDVGEVAGAGHIGVAIGDDVGAGLLGANVVIDFSRSDGLSRVLAAARRTGIAVVSGTTRLDATVEKQLDEAAKVIPVLWAPNTSLGVQVLAELVAEAVKRLGPGFDIEIVETHHKAKVDSPSGTAVRLADAARSAREDLRAIHGRDGNVGPRADDEIGIFAVRGGDVIGDHSVHLLGPGERIELTHRATNRDLFARGALRAARFLAGKPAGRYSMANVLEG